MPSQLCSRRGVLRRNHNGTVECKGKGKQVLGCDPQREANLATEHTAACVACNGEHRAAAEGVIDRGGTTNHYHKPKTISAAAFQLKKHRDIWPCSC